MARQYVGAARDPPRVRGSAVRGATPSVDASVEDRCDVRGALGENGVMRSPHALVVTLLVAGLALTGCTGSSASDATPTETSSPSGARPVATATPLPADGPEAAFETWWAAVRSADTVAACGGLTEGLQQRLMTEYSAVTGVEVDDCATLIRQSSAIYAAAGLPADVAVTLKSETADDAFVEVTYATGDCGTVHLARTAAAWVLTEISEECAS